MCGQACVDVGALADVRVLALCDICSDIPSPETTQLGNRACAVPTQTGEPVAAGEDAKAVV